MVTFSEDPNEISWKCVKDKFRLSMDTTSVPFPSNTLTYSLRDNVKTVDISTYSSSLFVTESHIQWFHQTQLCVDRYVHIVTSTCLIFNRNLKEITWAPSLPGVAKVQLMDRNNSKFFRYTTVSDQPVTVRIKFTRISYVQSSKRLV